MSSRSGGVRLAWADSDDGRWALAVAWAWAVGADLVPPPPAPPSLLAAALDDAGRRVLADWLLEAGSAIGEEVARGTPRSEGARLARAWGLVHAPIDKRTWRQLAGAVGPGVRGVARALLDDASDSARTQPPSYWTMAAVRRIGATWESCIGWGGTLRQVGEWPTREAALTAVRALRPLARIEERP